jgi:hypothetical protein
LGMKQGGFRETEAMRRTGLFWERDILEVAGTMKCEQTWKGIMDMQSNCLTEPKELWPKGFPEKTGHWGKMNQSLPNKRAAGGCGPGVFDPQAMEGKAPSLWMTSQDGANFYLLAIVWTPLPLFTIFNTEFVDLAILSSLPRTFIYYPDYHAQHSARLQSYCRNTMSCKVYLVVRQIGQ